MQKNRISEKAGRKNADRPDVPFGSNEVRLSPRQWVVAGVVLAAVFYLIPVLWERIEPLQAGPDYRIPYRLGNDYWLYDRYCRRVCSQEKIPVVGDSVIWGHYVASDRTLPHYLNELAGQPRFANLGVDGIHPAAMAGLIEYYGRDITSKHVLLGCNLLWTSSPDSDLSRQKQRPINHPELIPQFSPRIPCYEETPSVRLGIVVGHRVALFGWAKHLRMAYLDNADLCRWTIEHPYANPAAAITCQLPSPDEPPSPKPVAKPWTEQGIRPFHPPWVGLETSLQWRFFKQTVEILRGRGNRVFVLVGPFNEPMLTEESLAVYRARKRAVGAWLRENEIPHFIPDALPSRHYADASHPLAVGYALLAGRLFEDESFRRFHEAAFR
jgi:hypothetical protein